MRPPSAIIGILALLALAGAAEGCSVPVFRYALDRWAPDSFRLEIPASAPSPQRLLDSLGAGAAVNLSIIRDNAAAAIPDARLFFPHHEKEPVWRGAMDSAMLAKLAASPARTEIARRIVAGDTAVWIVVEPTPDDETIARLEKRLRFLEHSIALPVINPNDPTSKLGPGPALAVKFSILRLRRDDPAEAQFIPVLLGPKRDALPADAALLIPVFGRGRALGAWPAAKMDDDQITEAAQFLCGACSCEVKSLNPGWDLLMNFDWDAALAAFAPGDSVPRIEATREPAEPKLVPIAPAPVAPAPAIVTPPRWNPAIIALAALAAISGIVAWRARSSGR